MNKETGTGTFLGFRAEEKALEIAQNHAAIVYSILEKLNDAVLNALKDDRKALTKITDEISQLEMKADKLRRRMLLDLSKSSLEAADRESLSRLAKALDRVADWAHDSSRVLLLVPLIDFGATFKGLISNFAKLLAKCGQGLRGAITALGEDPEEATRKANGVEEAEEEADELYLKGLSLLPDIGKTSSAATLILLRDLLHNLENTADAAEDAIDQLRIIILHQS